MGCSRANDRRYYKMKESPYVGMWELMYDTVRAFWALTEPQIEARAREQNVPIELYYYGELGLEIFSLARFQRRDPYSNPVNFEQAFGTLMAGGWIAPTEGNEYRVTEAARAQAREIVRAGDEHLGTLEVVAAEDAERTLALLQRLVAANRNAAEPPQKWATVTRFRVANESSPLLAQIRELLMDLFAYRDDANLAAWRDYPVTGLAWNAFGMIWKGTAFAPPQMAEQAWFRGYGAADYALALVELRRRGWVDGQGQVTPIGKALRDAVEQLTEAYFYAPWLALGEAEIAELRVRLLELRNVLVKADER